MFKNKLANHKHNTRSKKSGNLNSVCHTTSLFEKAVSYRGAQVWNAIPFEIKAKEVTKSFKTALQGFYLDKSPHLHHHHGTR